MATVETTWWILFPPMRPRLGVQAVSKLTQSARGQQCQIRIPGWCNHNPETTVLAHAGGSAAGKGIGMKANDLLSAYACSTCHDIYDRRQPVDIPRVEVDLMFHQGHMRTLRIFIEKGLVKLAT
jgi:hypothetical protein